MKDVLLFAQVDQESLPATLRKQHQILKLRLSDGQSSGDFNTDARNLRRLLGPKWGPSTYDLLNVMCALRAADRFFTGKGFFDRQRNIKIAVGVLEPERWERLSPLLADTIRALSEDSFEFHPIRLAKTPKLAMPEKDTSVRILGPDERPDCVCLYSGGADSFVGAGHLLAEGRQPLLISHSVGPISGLQKRLFEILRVRFPKLQPADLVQLRSQPHTTKIARESRGRKLYWKTNDPLQRLRSIFFFSLAAIIAKATDVKEIFMCENGLIGAAIIFSPRDDNPYTTRPAEPHYLKTVERFLQEAVDDSGLQIRNPFQYMTKGEVLKYASTLGLRDALYQTVSCWRSGNRGVRNCGQCVPCLFRQLAFAEAAMPAPPQRYAYQHPIPARDWHSWRSRELERLEDMREYCANAVAGGIRWLFENELAVVDAIDVTGGPTRRPSKQITDQDALNRAASRKMARVILRFAQATVDRLR